MNMTRTQWFGGGIKPVHIGFYKKLCSDGSVGHQYWNGEFWCGWWVFIEDAKISKIESCFQSEPWCGLANKP